jgi:hypothetical protein
MAERWLTIAMASTLAGNFNCAGLDREPDHGGNWRVNQLLDYFRVGAPLTLITLALGTLWLSL